MARRGGFPGGAMPGNMNNLKRSRHSVCKSRWRKEPKEFEDKEWGLLLEAVLLLLKCQVKEVLSVKLSPEVVDPDDIGDA